MQTEIRIQDDPGLANRYLAGQLSPAELQVYEQHLLENPDVARELEGTARMKVGLANLRDSGQLKMLLHERAAPRWLWSSLAAAALVILAIGLWRGVDAPREDTLVATAGELLDRTGQPLAPGSSYALLRTRSSAYDAVIELPPQPKAIELRVRPETSAPAYSVALSRLNADGSVLQIGAASELPVQSDGFVLLYVDSSRLESGPYLLVMTPAGDRTAASSSAFRVKVVTPERQP
jgi:hypothetical protein